MGKRGAKKGAPGVSQTSPSAIDTLAAASREPSHADIRATPAKVAKYAACWTFTLTLARRPLNLFLLFLFAALRLSLHLLPFFPRFLTAATAAELNRAAVARDGARPRRQLAGTENNTLVRTLGRRPQRPCTVDEAVDDTASHLSRAFKSDDWTFVTVDYSVRGPIIITLLLVPFRHGKNVRSTFSPPCCVFLPWQPERAQAVLTAPFSDFVQALCAQHHIDPQAVKACLLATQPTPESGRRACQSSC